MVILMEIEASASEELPADQTLTPSTEELPADQTLTPSPEEGEVLAEDNYTEIVVRLPASHPEVLFRCSAVSRAWRRLLTDPGFLRRYRLFHGLPPLMGYLFDAGRQRCPFVTRPSPAAPVRLARFVATATVPFPGVPQNGDGLRILDSRHGIVLFSVERRGEVPSLVIWNPVADHHEVVRLPDAFAHDGSANFSGAIFCASPGCDYLLCHCHGGPFRVVFIGIQGGEGHYRSCAFVYSSASDIWSVSPAAAAAIAHPQLDYGFPSASSTLVATTLFFRTPGRILSYYFGDEAEERLAYIDLPPGPYFVTMPRGGTVLLPSADGRRLRLAAIRDVSTRVEFWESDVRADGIVDWVHTQALVELPVPGVRLLGATATSVFIRTRRGGMVSAEVGSGRVEALRQPIETGIFQIVPLTRFWTPSPTDESGSEPFATIAPVSDSSDINSCNDDKQDNA